MDNEKKAGIVIGSLMFYRLTNCSCAKLYHTIPDGYHTPRLAPEKWMTISEDLTWKQFFICLISGPHGDPDSMYPWK